jgi:hypothetical protein
MVTANADFLPGDPANHVVGKPEEKPARRHAPPPPKPIKTARGMLADIELRLQELEPLLEEYKLLVDLRNILASAPQAEAQAKPRKKPGRKSGRKSKK